MPQPVQPDPATTIPPAITIPSAATTPRRVASPATPSARVSAGPAPSDGGVLRDRGSGFRPYPTASTPTRLSPASPASRAVAARRRSRVGIPIPVTVWVPEPGHVVDPAAVWPAVILRQIVSAFSRPGDEVVLTPWPSDTSAAPVDRTQAAGMAQDRRARGIAEGDLDSALDTVARLHRCPCVGELGSGHTIDTPARDLTATRPTDDEPANSRGGTAGLVVTSMPPNPTGVRHTDAVALRAARELRLGGILVVLTHCHHDGGELRDPTGPMITAAQNADLLYLQHIVAVHLPVPDLRDTTTPASTTTAPVGSGAAAAGPDGAAAGPGSQPAFSGSAQPDVGGRAAHRRVHSDVLAFAQAHEHHSPGRAESDDEIPW